MGTLSAELENISYVQEITILSYHLMSAVYQPFDASIDSNYVHPNAFISAFQTLIHSTAYYLTLYFQKLKKNSHPLP
jgi:hypothetical protein